METKHMIIARSIIILLAVFIVGLIVLYIVKKRWILLVIHVLISLVLIRLLFIFGAMKFTSRECFTCSRGAGCNPPLMCEISESLGSILYPSSYIEPLVMPPLAEPLLIDNDVCVNCGDDYKIPVIGTPIMTKEELDEHRIDIPPEKEINANILDFN